MRAKKSFTILVTLTAVILGSCSAATPAIGDSADVTPQQRAVRLTTEGCGWAPSRTGSGLVYEEGMVVTAAHLVARADSVAVTVAAMDPIEAAISAVDFKRDLALLRIPVTGFRRVDVAPISPDGASSGVIVDGATSGTVPFTLERPARISIEEVLGNERHERLGYELRAATTGGDSGAGVYDDQNRLLGIVFATSDGETTTWATASSEITSFINDVGAGTADLTCDPERSRLDSP